MLTFLRINMVALDTCYSIGVIKFNHDCNVLSNGFVEDRERGQVHGECEHKWQNVNN